MKILALELSSRRGSIARYDDEEERFAVEFANDRKHSGAFFENLERVTREFDLPELIAVGIGPGSYAGVRIAIAAAIGLQTATGARMIGIPSICAIPAEAAAYDVIGDARRESFYYARIVKRNCAEGPTLCDEGGVRVRIAAATGPIYSTEPLPLFEQAKLVAPSATVLARLAENAQPESATGPLEPIYLREPHITAPKERPPAFRLPKS